VTGVDSSPSLLDMCRRRFPEAEWLVGDMRELDSAPLRAHPRWYSFFHLHFRRSARDVPRFADHCRARRGPDVRGGSEARGSHRRMARRAALPCQPFARRILPPAGRQRVPASELPGRWADCRRPSVWMARSRPDEVT
jgi:hypothetical protein